MLPIPQLTSMLLPTMLVLMALPARSGGGGIHSAERKSHAYILLTEYSRDDDALPLCAPHPTHYKEIHKKTDRRKNKI
jgi:hypothetical protein